MRNFGIVVVGIGLILMFLSFTHGVKVGTFAVADWAGIAIGAWFSLIGCILIPRKKQHRE